MPIGFWDTRRCSGPLPGSGLNTPGQCFSLAEKQGCVLALDRYCIDRAILRFDQQALPGKLFINVLPENLSYVESVIANAQFPAGRLVIEISEKYPISNFDELGRVIESLVAEGVFIAIDDLGAGYSGLKAWSQIKPHYVKIDRHFIDGIDSDPVKREFVRSICEISRGLKSHVIAEGIETSSELEALFSLNIRFGQGFLDASPRSPAQPRHQSHRV